MSEMTVEQRIKNEKRILKKLMIIMGGHGWWPELVDDGGEPDEHVPVRTAEAWAEFDGWIEGEESK